jgi:hypothetical protein
MSLEEKSLLSTIDHLNRQISGLEARVKQLKTVASQQGLVGVDGEIG